MRNQTNSSSEVTLLIVDDNAVFNDRLCRSLQRKEIKALSANNIDDALRQASANNIDGAIIDLKMERESGLSLIPHIRKEHPECRIIMLTGYASIATAVEAIKLGANNYLTKPANTDEILAAMFEDEAHSENTADTQSTQIMSVNRLEWEHIQKVLAENQGNISATARTLGMHRRTLQRKLQKHPAKQ